MSQSTSRPRRLLVLGLVLLALALVACGGVELSTLLGAPAGADANGLAYAAGHAGPLACGLGLLFGVPGLGVLLLSRRAARR